MGVRGKSRSGVAVGVFCAVRMQGKMLTIGILNAWYKYRGRGVETKRNRQRNISRGGWERGWGEYGDGDTVSMVLKKRASHVQVLLIEEVDLACEVRPRNTARKLRA
jgi:alpha/beta superfamily hydrolase